jgi:hypothetical protein
VAGASRRKTGYNPSPTLQRYACRMYQFEVI